MFSKKGFMVGLDIGTDSIKLARLSESFGKPAVESLAYVRLNTEVEREAEVYRGIKEILQGFNLKGRSVACSISQRDLVVRYFTLPHMSPAEIKEAVVWEAPKHLPFPLKEAVYDYLVDDVGDQTGSLLIMIAAMPEKIANGWLKLITKAGVPLGAIDAPGMALLAYFDLAGNMEAEKSQAVINLGYQFTVINIFKNNRLRLTRDIGVAGAEMDQAISELTGLSVEQAARLKNDTGFNVPVDGGNQELTGKVKAALEQTAEKIAVESQRSFDYYTSQYREQPIDRIYITGGGALIPGLRAYFESFLSMKVLLEDPFESLLIEERLAKDKTLTRMGPFFTTAIGLATRRCVR